MIRARDVGVVVEVPSTDDCGLRLVEFTDEGRRVLVARACGDAQCYVFAIDFAGNRRAAAIDRQFAIILPERAVDRIAHTTKVWIQLEGPDAAQVGRVGGEEQRRRE